MCIMESTEGIVVQAESLAFVWTGNAERQFVPVMPAGEAVPGQWFLTRYRVTAAHAEWYLEGGLPGDAPQTFPMEPDLLESLVSADKFLSGMLKAHAGDDVKRKLNAQYGKAAVLARSLSNPSDEPDLP